MKVKKISRIIMSVLLAACLLFAPLSTRVLAAEVYELNNPVKVYYDSYKARAKRNHSSTYQAGNYYIYRIYKGMINITKVPGVAGGWINPEDNINGQPLKYDEFKKAVGTFNDDKTEFTVMVKTFGYMNASKALYEKDSVNIIYPATYHIFDVHNGMINITEKQGHAGTWINPNSKEKVRPSIPFVEFKGSTTEKN